MLNQLERWVLHYDTVVKPYPAEAPNIPMREIVPRAALLQAQGDAVWVFQRKTAAVRIAAIDIDHDNEFATFLIHYADKNASDPVFGNLDTGELRTEPKLEGEGVAISAHLMISLKPSQSNQNVYLTVLEDVPGIGRTKLRSFLNAIFKKAGDCSFRAEDGTQKKCRPAVEIYGHTSQQLRDDLEGGVLSGFELVKYRNVNCEFDEDGFLEEKARVVTIGTKQKLSGLAALNVINRVKERAAGAGYAEMRVKYKRLEGPQKTITVGTAREDAGDAVSVKSAFLRVEAALPQCSEAIRRDVVEKMKNMLLAARDGIAFEEDTVPEIDYEAEADAPRTVLQTA